jgi:hypothetical protein
VPAESKTLRIALLLVRLNALLWLAFAILTAAGANPGIPDTPRVRWGLALLAGAGGLALLLLEVLLRRRSRVGYYATLVMLTVIALSLLADQFGLADLVVLAATAAPMILLIKVRDAFLKHGTDATQGSPSP